METKKISFWKKSLGLCLVSFSLLPLVGCDFLQSLTESRYKKKIGAKASEEDLVNWKEKLQLEDAEREELEKKLRSLVQKSNQSAALSWKIARAYMRAGSSDLGTKYYDRSIQEHQTLPKGYEIHSYESALPYFERAIQTGKIDKQLLYETAVAYANASKDMGWESTRRAKAVGLLKSLSKLDANDSRFPFQLALLYFDSSVKDGAWDGKMSVGYDDISTAFSLLDGILQKEPYNIPTRFAKANFLVQMGKTENAFSEYGKIKLALENLKKSGQIREPLEENSSYQNVLKNLEILGAQK